MSKIFELCNSCGHQQINLQQQRQQFFIIFNNHNSNVFIPNIIVDQAIVLKFGIQHQHQHVNFLSLVKCMQKKVKSWRTSNTLCLKQVMSCYNWRLKKCLALFNQIVRNSFIKNKFSNFLACWYDKPQGILKETMSIRLVQNTFFHNWWQDFNNSTNCISS
jgi:hypothetical protein